MELLPLNYFLEQNRAAVPTAYMKYGTTTPHFLPAQKNNDSRFSFKPDLKLPPGRRAPINSNLLNFKILFTNFA